MQCSLLASSRSFKDSSMRSQRRRASVPKRAVSRRKNRQRHGKQKLKKKTNADRKSLTMRSMYAIERRSSEGKDTMSFSGMLKSHDISSLRDIA
ncbi:hypothetical protein PAXRUDRAFT_559466 [Paxillus rubicundulus Ve08.2h10]|uniref:Uncharacterized protein n=1 Tax=Paxillus rubicundulus Ve08.2h10 TaxID=930991 RepID=A0A0D0DL11_9AGAM|nr:hypothetical protein PAXRUDRAFT_559466 [Paxillus rubicundulus Ve08.2h10]